MAEKQPGRAEVIEQGAAMIRKLNLFSDLFMSTALRDRDACEYVLRKILQREDLRITKVNTQWRLLNLTSKGAILDVFAEADDGSEIAELMRYFKTADPNDMSQGALSERVRYLKSEKGEPEMCEVSDWIYNQGRMAGEAKGKAEGMAEQARSTAMELHAMGMKEMEIARAVRVDPGTVQAWLSPAVM